MNQKHTYIHTKMSAAAIARKRRAESSAVSQNSIPSVSNPSVGPNANANANPSRNPTTGLTLPQVISVIDTRLIVLENFMKETKQFSENITMASNPVDSQTQEPGQGQDQSFQNHVIEEFETRFDILAGEIADLKDIVLKLQTYTMDVNKTLLEERIHILSDIEDPSKKVEPNTYGFECNQ